MKLLKLSMLTLPFLLLPYVFAGSVDTSQLNTGTFKVEDEYSTSDLHEEDQLRLQRQEEIESDSFGQDEYNQNIDPYDSGTGKEEVEADFDEKIER